MGEDTGSDQKKKRGFFGKLLRLAFIGAIVAESEVGQGPVPGARALTLILAMIGGG